MKPCANPECSQTFTPKRKEQKYCCKRCAIDDIKKVCNFGSCVRIYRSKPF